MQRARRSDGVFLPQLNEKQEGSRLRVQISFRLKIQTSCAFPPCSCLFRIFQDHVNTAIEREAVHQDETRGRLFTAP